MKDKIVNLEENKMMLKDEYLKLQRIEDQRYVTNAELLKFEASKDATNGGRVIANLKAIA
jgi:hypothetical protein